MHSDRTEKAIDSVGWWAALTQLIRETGLSDLEHLQLRVARLERNLDVLLTTIPDAQKKVR